MRGPRLIHMWRPLSHYCEEKMESVNQFAKYRKWRSENTISKELYIITRVPKITGFVAAFDAKAFNFTELLKSYLATEQDY